METRATRRPGQKGTRKLVERYEDRLLFVRYRYDPSTSTHVKTVELIVSKRVAAPQEPASALHQAAAVETNDRVSVARPLAGLRIAAQEALLRDKVRGVGGYWDPKRGVWVVPAEQVSLLGLESRLVLLT